MSKLAGPDLYELISSALHAAEMNGNTEILTWEPDQIAIDLLDCSTDFEGIYTVEELVPTIKLWLGARFPGLS